MTAWQLTWGSRWAAWALQTADEMRAWELRGL
jgi:hypothetical protein